MENAGPKVIAQKIKHCTKRHHDINHWV